MSSFEDKNILITGGAGGIGLLLGEQALNKGAQRLIIWDINKDNIANARRKLDNFADRLVVNRVDISDPDEIYPTAKEILTEHGHIDILINNAGTVVGQFFEKHSSEEINRLININLLGAMHTTRAFIGDMKTRNTGHIVNIASAAGRIPNPGMSVYAASKWGMIGWSESLRLELSRNTDLRVTTIEPSYIDTGLFEGVTPPVLTPLLDPLDISKDIIYAVERNKIHLRAPFTVKLIPFLKGVLPTRIFDIVAGKLFQVYHSMDTFKGRTTKSD
ncbi:MAG: SDR family NAD(P)-dependent oxidoreductase [Bacteroidota bacterium]